MYILNNTTTLAFIKNKEGGGSKWLRKKLRRKLRRKLRKRKRNN